MIPVRFLWLALLSVLAAPLASLGQEPPDTNYDESKVGQYTLPDPLVCFDGRKVSDAAMWREIRRPEILRAFAQHIYGRTPQLKTRLRFEPLADNAKVFDGLATRKQIRIRLLESDDAPWIDLLLYVPNHVGGPAPAFLGLNYGNQGVHSDAGIVPSRNAVCQRGEHAQRWPLELILKRGYAVACFHGGDIELDRHGSGCRFTTEGWQKGIRHYVMRQSGRSELADDEWGSIGAWAWGLSRALDYLQTDPAIDASRVAVFGHSRTGKTALWAGAQDERFALVISNNSGQGGASLARRRYGETVAASNSMSGIWYCRNYQKFSNNEAALPVDAHLLIALMAPRPVYVASAEKDRWADPRGEFLAAKHAEPVYELLGRPGLGVADMPGVDRPVGRTIGYHIRTGDHDITPYDWGRYLDFADRHLRRRRVLYNFDGDSCLSTKAGGKGPVPVNIDDVKRLIEEVAYDGSRVDTVLVCINAQVMYYPTKVGTMRGTLSTSEERAKWPASEKQRFENVKAFFDGGVDPYAVMLAETKKRGREALLTFRMNDDHGNDFLRTQFLADHPDWRLGTEQYRGKGAMDFGRQEVRDYTFRLIEEAVNRYDGDGIELDFNRFPTFFKDGTTDERVAKMNDLVQRVRTMLDETGAKRGRRLVLGVRVPSNYGRTPPTPDTARQLGCDVPAWAKHGWVDFVAVSEFLFERGDLPIGLWKRAIPTVPVYGGIECTKGGGQKNLTADEYRRAALALKKAGADGTYLFNFFTSREEGENAYEPPFAVLRDLEPAGQLQSLDGRWQIAKDPKDVGKTNRWYTETGFPHSESRAILVPGNIYEAWCRYNGLAWYSRAFSLAMPKTADMRYYLRFGACEYSCDVWLNGTFLGSHEGASSPFEFDVSGPLRPGENFVAVRVFSPGSALWKGGNYPVAFDMGGLTQHVTLACQPRVRITDVFVRPDWKTGNAPLEVTLENNAGAKATATLTAALSEHKSAKHLRTVTAKAEAPPGQSVQRLTLSAGPPRLWSLEDPFLYSVKVTLDCASQQDVFAVPHVGFRDFRINEHGYFELNGKRVFPKCTHSNVYDPVSILGTSRDMKYVTPDFPRMKDAGFNMFREIMYAALPEQLDRADELGYLIYNEHQAAWVLRDASKFAVDLPGVIRRDRNHPSLVIWGMLNETPAGPVYAAAKAFLPALRKLDDTRLVLLGSGRWDKDTKTGSASNPGSVAWDVDIGDAHIYPTFPTNWGFVTSMANMANDPRPTFVSEGGIGSSYNAYAEKRKLQQAGASNDAFAWGWINPMIDGLEKIWAKHKLHEVYPSIETMLVDSQKLAARERALWFNILRSNPKVNGYSLTGHSDYWGYAEGVTDTFGEFKADHLAAMQDGWARLKWCLLVHPMNAYAHQPFRVRVALANEDQLAPGNYRARLSISGPSGEVWRKETGIAIRGGVNPPLAYAVLDEDVKPAGLTEGTYTLTATLVGMPNASADRLVFTVTDKNKHPDLTKTAITVLGVSPSVKDLLTSRGATLRDYAAGQSIDREVLLVGAGVSSNAATWRPLYQRIARGAHAVFLAPAALDGGPKSVNKWLAIGKKGTRTRPHEWLYHSDTIAKNHLILNGLPAKVMTPDSYGPLLGGEFFSAVADPQQAVAVRLYCTTATTWEGLMVGIYQHHAGRFTINAFDLVGNLGNPAADRMLLNMAAHAATDAAPVHPLPANYDAELNALGIVDDVKKGG